MKRRFSFLLCLILALVLLYVPAIADAELPEYMVKIEKTTTERCEFMQSVPVEVGVSYCYEFTLSNTITNFELVFRSQDSNHSAFNGSSGLLSKTAVGNFITYKFFCTIPQYANNGNAMAERAFFILRSNSTFTGYFINPIIYKLGDTTKTNLLTNSNFANGLSKWAYEWVVLSGSSYSGSGITFTVVETDESLFVSDYSNRMLYVRCESADMGGEALVTGVERFIADTSYICEFDCCFNIGALDNAVDFVLMATPSAGGNLKILFNSSQPNDLLISSTDMGGKKVYVFNLDENALSDVGNMYVGFYFKSDRRTISDFYIAHLNVYPAFDTEKTNMIYKQDLSDMSGWRSKSTVASVGDTKFGTNKNSSLDYTAYYVEYDESVFKIENKSVHYGDSNFDGFINLLDLVSFKKYLAGDSGYIANYDINCDLSVDLNDALFLARYLIDIESIVWDKDGTSNLQSAEQLSGGADSEAIALKEQIETNADTLKNNTGRKIYVSADGKATNNGLSEKYPINLTALYSFTLKSGDVILFRRGDTFRITKTIPSINNTGYGAYGTGAKPIISGSLQDYAQKPLWKTEDGFIWQVSVASDTVGNIIFNGGEYTGFYKASIDELIHDGDFWFDGNNHIIYLYFRQLNPGEYFDSIEISSVGTVLNANKAKNITVENLDIRYMPVHAFNFYNPQNLSIIGCKIGWVGGYNGYGNAIQLWSSATNCTASLNYIYQIYDAALTFQGKSSGTYSGVTFTQNLVEYTSMNFEFWDNADATFSNITFSDNMLRFAGYGFSGKQRNTIGNEAFILGWYYTYDDGTITDFNISNNIFDIARCRIFYASCLGNLTLSGNTYYQNSYSEYPVGLTKGQYATSSSTLKSYITSFDGSAATKWVN